MNIIENNFGNNNIKNINSNECIVYCTSEKLGKLSKNNVINNWSKNRPKNEKKVKEIEDSINDNTFVGGILFLFLNKKKKKFLCYDGNNRREALINSNKNIICLLNIVYNCNEEFIRKRFITLGKAVPIPQLYFSDNNFKNSKFKNNINQLVEKIINQFSIYETLSNKPIRPNFNRTVLTDKLEEYFKNIGIADFNVNEVFKIIMKLNKEYSKGENIDLENKKKYSTNMIEKAKKNNCYIFLNNDFLDDLKVENIF